MRSRPLLLPLLPLAGTVTSDHVCGDGVWVALAIVVQEREVSLATTKTASTPTQHGSSLLYPCFKTAFCYGVVSGCFVPRVSPSPRIRLELAPKRGLEGSGLAFRRPESARKVRAKSFGPQCCLAGIVRSPSHRRLTLIRFPCQLDPGFSSTARRERLKQTSRLQRIFNWWPVFPTIGALGPATAETSYSATSG